MNQYKHHRGYSLVETLVAITVLLVAISAPLTIASRSLQHVRMANESMKAVALAQEGVEAVTLLQRNAALASIADPTKNSWAWYWDLRTANSNCFDLTKGCPMDFSQTTWGQPVKVYSDDCGTTPEGCRIYLNDAADQARFNHTNGTATPYIRKIYVIDSWNPADTQRQYNQVMVRSEVTWTSPQSGSPHQVEVETNLFDFATSTI